MTNNLCERMLADSMNRGQQMSIDELFAQHQMLTKTVAQCSQLLWLQQKQITELRNALVSIENYISCTGPEPELRLKVFLKK